MNASDKIGTKGGVHGAVARYARHLGENRGPQAHTKMAFAAVAIAGMSAMILAFVNNLNVLRRKGLLQPVTNFVSYTHFSPCPSFSPAQKR